MPIAIHHTVLLPRLAFCFRLLPHDSLYRIEDKFAAEAGVDTEVVVVGVAPDLVGVVAVVAAAASVGFGDGAAGFAFVQALGVHDALHAMFDRCVQEEADAAVVIAQDVVGAAANDDAVAAAGAVFHCLGLSFKDGVLRCVFVGVHVGLVH